jgi:hypothetical protein
LTLLAGATIGASACGRSAVFYEEDSFSTGDRVGAGGAHTGGTGGRGGLGGAAGTSGSANVGGNGTAGGAAGIAGMSPVGGAGPFACPSVAPTCNTYTEFPADPGVTWGRGAFTGGFSVYGAGLARDPDASVFRVTGTVGGYGRGFTIWFTRCSNLAEYTGVQMTLSGSAGPDGLIAFQPLTNSDYPWQPRPQDGKGACTSASSNPYDDCIQPAVEFLVTGAPLFISWTAISGGTPVMWDAMASPSEIVGLQWEFPWSDGKAPYMVDLSLDDVFLWGEGSVNCGSSQGGMGGMGGGAGSGVAGSGTSGGGSGGHAGAAAAGASGAGNEGGAGNGAAGEAGAPGSGAPGFAGFGGI